MKTRVFALTLLVLAFAAPAVAAPTSGRSTVLHISAKASGLAYSTTHLTARHGSVTIVMKNLSPLQHDVSIKGNGVNAKGKVVGKGGTSTVTATLTKGTYTFLCTVPGHAAAGMKGKLTIT
jgi:plastocyanin